MARGQVAARERALRRRAERDHAQIMLTKRLPEDPAERVHTIWESAETVGRAFVARCLGVSYYGARKIIDSHDFNACPWCGPRNPKAPHRVYLFHFAHLAAFKVGITNVDNDARLLQHRRAGGTLLQVRTVPTWLAALTLERQILTYTASRRLRYGKHEFPKGGGTECWADDLNIDLEGFPIPSNPV